MKTFDDHLRAAIRSSRVPQRALPPGECQSPAGHCCSLCHAVRLDYASELAIKERAVRSFLERHVPAAALGRLVPSPLGRNYRSVTKRRLFRYRGKPTLGLIAPTEEGSYRPFDVVSCAIEPAVHAPMYHYIQSALEKAAYQPLAEVLSYVIIKGNYSEFTIILNVHKISSHVVSAANTLSRLLTRSFTSIVALFLYEDASDGRYYLGSREPRRAVFRKIFGNKEIFQRICGRSFLYSPLSFSQVNISMVDRFAAAAGELLALDKETTLFDLYCGYGLFALCCAEKANFVVGVDSGAESIASAITNARRQKVANSRFLRSNITADTIPRIISRMRPQDAALLDPPRSGTSSGVIEAVATRKPTRVLHIFCNIDILPSELERWEKSGYVASRVVPFDMFPGTSVVETMALLTPS